MTRRRYPVVDDQGTSVADFTGTPSEVPIKNCWAEPIDPETETQGRVAARSGFRCTAPEGTDLDSFVDHVAYAGVEYELDGDAVPVTSPTGGLNEVMFTLRRWRHAS